MLLRALYRLLRDNCRTRLERDEVLRGWSNSAGLRGG